MNHRFTVLFLIIIFLISASILNSQLLFRLGNQGDTWGRALAIDKDSNFILAGTFQGTLNCNLKGTLEINSNLGSTDVFFAKYDKRGNVIWAKSIGTSVEDVPTVVSVDKSGNVFITGYFGSADVPGRFIDLDPGPKEAKFIGKGGIDAFLIKLNSAGDYQWGFLLTNIEGNSTDIIRDMVVNKSGQVYVTGIFSGTVDFNPKGSRKRITCPTNGYGYFTAKYDKAGVNLWTNIIGANIQNPIDEGFASIDLDGSDGCVIGANFSDTAIFQPDINTNFPMVSAGLTDMFIARYSSQGTIMMRGGFGGSEKDRIFPRCTKIGTDGNIYVSGNFLGKADFYPSFGTQEIENIGTDPEIFLASYTLSGAYRWVINMPTDLGEDVPSAMEFDFDGNVLLSGYFTGTTDFDAYGTKELTSKGKDGAADVFLAKYDNGGHIFWVDGFGSDLSGNDKWGRPQISVGQSMVMDYDDNVIFTGRFFGNIDFDPSENLSVLTAEKQFDLFLAKYDYDGYLWFEGGVRPALRIVSPNGGETWNVDSVRVITWYSKNIDLLRIEYSIDAGASWMLIADSMSASSSSYSWVVENNPSEECKMKITDISDEKYFDISNGYFSITSEIKPTRVIFSWGNPMPVAGKTVATDSKNNFIVAGSFQGTINCDQGIGMVNLSSKGINDMALAKYDELGGLIWAFNVGADGMICEPNCIAVDGADNIYIAGFFGRSGSAGDTMNFNHNSNLKSLITTSGLDAFIAKYSTTGQLLWVVPLGNKDGTTKESVNDISVERNGNIFVTGIFSGTVDFDASKSEKLIITPDGITELFVANFANDGKNRWVIGINANMQNPDIEGLASIYPDRNGGCYLSGNFRDSVNFDPLRSIGQSLKSKSESDIYIARYKSTGYLDWVINIEGSGNDNIVQNSMKLSPAGNICLSGVFDGKADFSPGLIKRELTSVGNNKDIFIASYTSAGDYRWARNLPSIQGNCMTKGISFDTAGSIVLTGHFSGDIEFGDFDNSISFTSNGIDGATDIFLAKFDFEGKALWANHFGPDTTGIINNSTANSLAIDGKNNIILTGNFFGEKVDFDPAIDNFYLNSQGQNDAFIAKYFEDGKLWIQAVDSSQLYLKSPNGGEKWQTGSKQLITWNSKYIENLSLSYSTNGGADWIVINNTVSAESGSYTWIIPDTPSSNCKVLIFDSDNARRMDASAREFTITDRTINISSPNGGEMLKGNQPFTIRWSSKNVSYIDILFSTNGGDIWVPAIVYLSASSGTYSWIVKNVNSNKCLFKIIDKNDSAIYDLSDGFFTIERIPQPSMHLLYPNGGETLMIGHSFDIVWQSEAVDKIKIEFSKNAGLDWDTIASDYSAESLSYSWYLDNGFYRSDSCLIRLSSMQNGLLYDTTDSLFAIDYDISVNENENNAFRIINIYPNPVKDYLRLLIDSKQEGNLQIEITNNLGQIQSHLKYDLEGLGIHLIDLKTNDFPEGLYFLKISFWDTFLSRKFVIIR